MPFIHVSRAEQDPDIPKSGEEVRCTEETCPGEKGWEVGYGLAGGGIGIYMYCNKCEKVVSKDQDTDPDGP